MARQKYVQWTPIAPLNLLGRIDATVTSENVPICTNQKAFPEDTDTTGLQMDLILLALIPL